MNIIVRYTTIISLIKRNPYIEIAVTCLTKLKEKSNCQQIDFELINSTNLINVYIN